jgi:acetate kinase
MLSLVLNIGSTSIKYSVYKDKELIIKSKTDSILELIADNKPDRIIVRIVFGGENILPIVINQQSLKELRKYDNCAPLHNPPTMDTIEQILEQFPKIKIYGVFDSAFHSTIEDDRKVIPLPTSIAAKFNFHKYGFHGFSHQYLSEQYSKSIDSKKYKIITCHLGGGCSVTAIKNGKSIATSMGYGPDEGLVMVKRAGVIGANVVLSLIEDGNTTNQVRDMIYKESGIKGLTGSDDVKAIFASTDKASQLAFRVFINSVLDYISAYISYLDGVDCVILSGGIGENNTKVQKYITNKLKLFNISLLVIPTNEELMMITTVDIHCKIG